MGTVNGEVVVTSNAEVLRVLEELAALTELDDGDPNSFRVRAYTNAHRAVAGLSQPVAEMTAAELTNVTGIGKGIAGRIRELVETGRVARLDQLREAHPPGKQELRRLPGVGPKLVAKLHHELGVVDLAGLVQALEDGRVGSLEGMGERSVANLRTAIDKLGLTSKERRVPLADALPVAELIVDRLRGVAGVVQVTHAGSLRRFRETVGDLDVLVATEDPAPVHTAFRELELVAEVVVSGTTKTSVVSHDGLRIDLRTVQPASFGAALVYFTGSKAHNIRLRQRAQERGLTMNEYGLSPSDEPQAAGPPVTTEEQVYAALQLPWITPELREDDGELPAAEAGMLPRLPTLDDLRGDLHDHTDLSGDGRDPLERLVAAAADRGLEYLAITDHAEDLTINGVSREQMLAQRRELRELEQRRGDLRLLHGAELNIGIHGELDYDPAFLAGFDWLVASVHSHLTRGVEEQTTRVVTAMREPSVTAIGHLTGRLIGTRPGIELDLDRVLQAAVETGTAIEINASLRRLDATVEVIREGARRGVTFVISTDAHAAAELDRARYGVQQARRAGLDVGAVANTWPLARFESWVAAVRRA